MRRAPPTGDGRPPQAAARRRAGTPPARLGDGETMSAPPDTPSAGASDASAGAPERRLWVCRLGSVPYRDAVEIQQGLQARRQEDEIADTLLLLEHPAVYTRGRRAEDSELSLGEDFYRRQGIDVVTTNRGGRVTYHGPGQLVGYPIMRVEDVIGHLRTMENAIVAALAQEGVDARSRVDDGPDWTGVWVGQRKIASLGVHISRGVSTHGFAVNVVNDLTPFTWVVPCGLAGVSMTSVAQERMAQGRGGQDEIDVERFARRVVARFAEAHSRTVEEVPPALLGIDAPAAAGASPVAAAERFAHAPASSAARAAA